MKISSGSLLVAQLGVNKWEAGTEEKKGEINFLRVSLSKINFLALPRIEMTNRLLQDVHIFVNKMDDNCTNLRGGFRIHAS